MAEVDEFLALILPPLRNAETAIHNGDAEPRAALWSHHDPVTVFGAAKNATGWSEIAAAFDWLASRFSGGTCEFDVIAAGASGDLAYLLTHEHTTVTIRDGDPETYELRVTWAFRRERGHWKAVHRHADPVGGGEAARRRLAEPSGE